jgi:hypothetical protein
MDVSGVCALQCDHIFVLGMVDLPKGEQYASSSSYIGLADHYRHAHVHFLLNRGLNVRRFDEGYEPELALSYNAMCILKPNLIKCFALNHPETLHRLLNAKFLVPAIHVRNHKEMCKYVYTHAYTPGVGRFYGETAEYTSGLA